MKNKKKIVINLRYLQNHSTPGNGTEKEKHYFKAYNKNARVCKFSMIF